jgi:heme/copper-type cytochrome/quinol oxidase subunit 2
MNQINFNQKYLLIFITILIIILFILSGLLIYFLYYYPKNETENNYLDMSEEAINTPAPVDINLTKFSQEELEASINTPVKIK